MTLAMIGSALGGIGLFLLGMRLMTDGLKVAAGSMLRDILARSTRSKLRGLLSGMLITGVVQSSSAVTVAAIGFVNAGVMTLGPAMWVIFGSNVGTTATGWIVSLVGFDIRIEGFALPLLGAGMLLTLTGVSTKRGALGEALAGFGAFFLGIATLKAAFGEFGAAGELPQMIGTGILNDVMMVLAGFVMTSLVQSSSAVIAIALTAAGGQLLTIEAGAAMVIGANIGTTTTALLAVLSATPNARRVAASHVVFNVLTGLVAVLLLPLLLLTVAQIETWLELQPSPTTTLALFHTTFNVLGVVIIWPLAGRLEAFLQGRFMTTEESEGQPRFLDRSSLEVPALAVGAVLLELRHAAGIALGAARVALTDPHASPDRLERRNEVVVKLGGTIVEYIQQLNARTTSAETAAALTHPIRALTHFIEISELAVSVARLRRRTRSLPKALLEQIDRYAAAVAEDIDLADRSYADPSIAPPTEERSEPAYQRTKGEVLAAAASGGIDAEHAELAIELLADVKAMAHRLDRSGKRIAAISKAISDGGKEKEEEDKA